MPTLASLDFTTIYQRLCAAITTGTKLKHCHFIGIERGGMWLANKLYHDLVVSSADQSNTQTTSHLGSLNISFHRDDYQQRTINPHVQPSHIPFAIDGKDVLLIDDILMTGRTIRAALNEIFDFGRPNTIRLACLVDIGMRELPIRPDYCGKTMHIASNARIELAFDAQVPRLDTLYIDTK